MVSLRQATVRDGGGAAVSALLLVIERAGAAASVPARRARSGGATVTKPTGNCMGICACASRKTRLPCWRVYPPGFVTTIKRSWHGESGGGDSVSTSAKRQRQHHFGSSVGAGYSSQEEPPGYRAPQHNAAHCAPAEPSLPCAASSAIEPLANGQLPVSYLR